MPLLILVTFPGCAALYDVMVGGNVTQKLLLRHIIHFYDVRSDLGDVSQYRVSSPTRGAAPNIESIAPREGQLPI